MQIVIPMSGFGERFRSKGYGIPKPLIPVDGKPLIQHVTEMYPGAESFIFICNENHLADEKIRMKKTLEATQTPHQVVAIAEHKLGPIHAILQAKDIIEENEDVIVSYSDFSCNWDFEDFRNFVRDRRVDCVVPAYKGFHPHSAGKTNYAYIKEDKNRISAVSEKRPFTEDKTQEYTSSGAYYFKSASIMINYFEKVVENSLTVAGEYYVSSAVDLLAKDGLDAIVYPIQHFMQWGTPEDLEEYIYWSSLYAKLDEKGGDLIPINGVGNAFILAAGSGSRFTRGGYRVEKPLLRFSGQNLLEQIQKCLPDQTNLQTLCKKDSATGKFLRKHQSGNFVEIDKLSAGQAESTKVLMDALPEGFSGSFTVLPCDTLFGDSTNLLQDCLDRSGTQAIIVWVSAPNPRSLEKPQEYGWIGVNGKGVSVSVKEPPHFSDPKVITGGFTFTSKSIFEHLYSRLHELDMTVNGEFYLDSMVEIAAKEGVEILLFEPEFCMSVGTPTEFETARYWQAGFSAWQGHRYTLEKDPFLNPGLLPKVREELASTQHMPQEWGQL